MVTSKYPIPQYIATANLELRSNLSTLELYSLMWSKNTYLICIQECHKNARSQSILVSHYILLTQSSATNQTHLELTVINVDVRVERISRWKYRKVKWLAVTGNGTQDTGCATSALPLTYDNLITSSPHNALHVLHRWDWNTILIPILLMLKKKLDCDLTLKSSLIFFCKIRSYVTQQPQYMKTEGLLLQASKVNV